MAMKEAERQPAVVFDGVEQAVKEYQSKPYTPELVTQVYQTIWQERGKLVGAIYEVPPCPYTQEELTALEQQGKRAGYLPKELATQENRHLLGKMFPNLKSYGVQVNNNVTNDENPSGWFDYETGMDAPYLDTTEKQLIERIAKEGRKLLSLNQYIIASQDNKLFTGPYLDEEATWTRLGSRHEGCVVSADFFQDGYLYVYWYLGSDYHDRGLGGRSSGVK